MTAQDHHNPDSGPLFEMPSGIDVVPEERHLISRPQPGIGDAPLPRPAGGDAPGDIDDGEFGIEDGEMLLRGFDPEADIHRTNRQEQEQSPDRSAEGMLHQASRRALRRQIRVAARSPGAHFVYALIALTVAIGVLGLALTWRDGRVLAACAVITPLSLAWFFIRFRAWLNSAPYWYRLLTSLGENAENLSHFSVRRWVTRAIRALYA